MGLLIATIFIFLGLNGTVYYYRNHPAVIPRSPILILTGGLALMCDSVVNYAIQMVSIPEWQCFMGIFTTVTFHYIAWSAIFFRAWRIGKFFDLYERYLD